MDANAKAEKVTALLTELTKFPKGERASKGARKIRRQLRKLGYYLSKVSDSKTEKAEATN